MVDGCVCAGGCSCGTQKCVRHMNTCTCTHVHMYTNTHVPICTCTHVHMYTCTHTTHTHTHQYQPSWQISTYVHDTHIQMYTCTHIYITYIHTPTSVNPVGRFRPELATVVLTVLQASKQCSAGQYCRFWRGTPSETKHLHPRTLPTPHWKSTERNRDGKIFTRQIFFCVLHTQS